MTGLRVITTYDLWYCKYYPYTFNGCKQNNKNNSLSDRATSCHSQSMLLHFYGISDQYVNYYFFPAGALISIKIPPGKHETSKTAARNSCSHPTHDSRG